MKYFMNNEIKETPFEDLISIKVLQKMLRLENRIEELEQINEEHRKLNGTLHQEIEMLEKDLAQWKKKYGDQ